MLIPLFSPDQMPAKERYSPLDHIEEDIAQYLVEQGLAEWWMVRFRCVQLRKTQKQWDRYGLSCAPKAFVIEAASQGKDWACAITNGWAFHAPTTDRAAAWLDGAPTWQ